MKKPLLIVWSVLAVSQVIYLLIPVPSQDSPPPPDLFPLILGSVALVQGVGIVALLRIRAFAPIREGRLDPASAPGGAQLFTTLIMAWVLAESVAIYGFVVRFMHFEFHHSFPFAVGGAFLLYLGRPWQAKLELPRSLADLAKSNDPIS
jgi:hypothetical protein